MLTEPELAALVRRSAEAGTLAATTALLVTKTIELDELAAEEAAFGPAIAGRVLGARPLWADAAAQHPARRA